MDVFEIVTAMIAVISLAYLYMRLVILNQILKLRLQIEKRLMANEERITHLEQKLDILLQECKEKERRGR